MTQYVCLRLRMHQIIFLIKITQFYEIHSIMEKLIIKKSTHEFFTKHKSKECLL